MPTAEDMGQFKYLLYEAQVVSLAERETVFHRQVYRRCFRVVLMKSVMEDPDPDL